MEKQDAVEPVDQICHGGGTIQRHSDLSFVAAQNDVIHQHSMYRGNVEAHNNADDGGKSKALTEPSFACAHGILNTMVKSFSRWFLEGSRVKRWKS